ncbi:hypothetical protein F1D05_10775 [Kribbella qitaiheensis]|uniref:Uncharacterized protein n=1 Tax=Kribbella qitaiheensis TaxID=1544730 RepID=A0A7G6WWC1_9ACTN|nr:hypothetical protein [Kribbella qitaiheensis]QNE18286.1 hypothetical protein F1D05_10775 [Kribbella qitaiheensis]
MIDDILHQAATAARDTTEPGWIDISASIQQRLRSVTRRSHPIRAITDTGATMFVTDHVLTTQLRRQIAQLPGCELEQVQLVGDGDTCTGAVIDIVTLYGHDLHALATQIRTITYQVFTDLLGPGDPPFGTDGVDVTITDLTRNHN